MPPDNFRAAVTTCCAASGGEVKVQDQVEQDKEWERVNKSAERAIAYLLRQQQSNGAIVENNRHHTTMTAFAIMGMLAVGHRPADQTPQGLALRKALDYVLLPDRIDDKGYFGERDGSRMYGQGIITLMLAESLGMGVDDRQDKLIRERLEKAVQLILKAQAVPKAEKRHEGGWRYNPDATDSDLSVGAWQLIALRRQGRRSGHPQRGDQLSGQLRQAVLSPLRQGQEPGVFLLYAGGFEHAFRLGGGRALGPANLRGI